MQQLKLNLRTLSLKFLCLSQVIFLVVLCPLLAYVWGLEAAKSLLLGALSWMFPSLFFAAFFLRNTVQTSYQLLLNFYIGEFLKLLFSTIFVVLSFKFLSLRWIPFFVGYAGGMLTSSLAILSMMIKKRV